jgi:outer membrane protein assembly factor BamB
VGPKLAFAAECLALLSCGARSPLEAISMPEAAGVATDAAAEGGARGPEEAGVGPRGDPCPSAVSGPKPMAGNCSTRDGRSRVRAPKAPQVHWSIPLPTDTTAQVGPSAIATDASGSAYVALTAEIDQSIDRLQRIRTSDGTALWSAPIVTGMPIVLANGLVDAFASDTSAPSAIHSFDSAGGASTSTTFGFDLYYALPDIAVGADGSLYVEHADGVGTVQQTTYISRVTPSAKTAWTSVDLATLGPPPETGDGEVFPSTVALGKDDLVVIEVQVLATAGTMSVTSALDPATGAVRWTTTLPGAPIGGPAVRADGSIVVLLSYYNGGSALVSFDPVSGTSNVFTLAAPAYEIFALAVDGTALVGSDSAQGVTGLTALAPDGRALWTYPVPNMLGATIAQDGEVIAYGRNVVALDGATGRPLWHLDPPSPSNCIADAALTSTGDVVVLACNGTLFGAGD